MFVADAFAKSTTLQPNSFTAGPNMNAARYDAAATLLPSGNLLLAGGGSCFLDILEIYRYRTNSFVPASALPSMTHCGQSHHFCCEREEGPI
jgi:hypothetical protein